MTPLASHMFMAADDPVRKDLLESQFFECSPLLPLALEMREADLDMKGFSPDIQLPAPRTFIELSMDGRRRAFLCAPHTDGSISAQSLVSDKDEIARRIWRGRFWPGSQRFALSDGAQMSHELRAGIILDLLLIEKMLLLLYQPGLVERLLEDADKGVIQVAHSMGWRRPILWHVCQLKPGRHGIWSHSETEYSRERPLHYVRRHFNRSIGKNVEGYWRGNADLPVAFERYKV